MSAAMLRFPWRTRPAASPSSSAPGQLRYTDSAGPATMRAFMNSARFHGLLVIDKPVGMTSRDVVNRAQGWFPRGTRIGHTGTLDPLATGVLVLCVGSATRLTEFVQDMTKTYRAGLLLGTRSDTDDADGALTPVDVGRPPQTGEVAEALASFIGAIE